MLDHQPFVSCIIPAFNAESYIAKAIESLRCQSYPNFEIIVVDDGSTDGTPSIVERLARFDSRLNLLRLSNSKQAIARNQGVERARGELIANLDADDVAVPDRIEKQAAFLKANPDVVAVGGAQRLIDHRDAEIGVEFFPLSNELITTAIFAGNPSGGLAQSTSMIRKDAFELVGGYRADFVPAEDYDLWLRLSSIGHLRNLPDVLVNYRLHPASASSTGYERQLAQTYRAVAEACNHHGRTTPTIAKPRLPMTGIDRMIARYLTHGKRIEAFVMLRQLAVDHPFCASTWISILRWFHLSLLSTPRAWQPSSRSTSGD